MDMINRLLIIADDVTGAMDTGVCFSAAGISTRVYLPQGKIEKDREESVSVCVLDTRHVTPDKAYEAVYGFISEARDLGFTYFYKKTDSALRGNPGAELSAMRDALGTEKIHFLPSYPLMNRLTKGGVHYINGVPVSESVFARDPFNPVTMSDVRQILESQGDVEGIEVYDAVSDDDLRNTASGLTAQGERVFAGCAGLAGVLPDILDLPRTHKEVEPHCSTMMVMCGSVNPISLIQCNNAEKRGYPRYHLDIEAGAGAQIGQISFGVIEEQMAILDTGSSDVTGEGIDERMKTVAAEMAKRASGVMRSVEDMMMFIIGGDTMLEFLRQNGVTQLVPHPTPFPGTVLGSIEIDGKERYMLSKSGGFGEPDLIEKVFERMISAQK